MDAAEPTLEQLRDRAHELDIEGRSNMNKAELAQAVIAAEQQADLAARDVVELATAEPDVSGRTELAQWAEDRAAKRKVRVVGARKEH
jgi:RNA-binding protein YhbY